MANNRYEGDAEAYRKFLENPEEFSTQLENRNTEAKKPIPRRRLREKHYVGYGSPPTETRWKKGESGNRSGRPQGSMNLRATIERLLTDKITVREGDKIRRVTRLEAVLMKQLQQALRGDLRAIQAVNASANSLGLLEVRPQKIVMGSLAALTDDELQEFKRLLEKVDGRIVPG
jgi:hypothetical protein